MAYEESIAEQIRRHLANDPRFVEKKMFGGVGFLLYGNMCVGVWKDQLIVRAGMPAWTELVQQPNVKEFDITGRSMKGWLMVLPDGFDTDHQLEEWLQRGIEFTLTLPPK